MAATIREWRAGDESPLRDCIAELQDHERPMDSSLRAGVEMADGYLQQLFGECDENSGTLFVAEDAGEVVGFVAILSAVPYESLDDPRGTYALVSDLVVREHARRRGIGETLLKEAERFARERGATVLRVAVRSANESAIRLYRRFGFAPHVELLRKRLDE